MANFRLKSAKIFLLAAVTLFVLGDAAEMEISQAPEKESLVPETVAGIPCESLAQSPCHVDESSGK